MRICYMNRLGFTTITDSRSCGGAEIARYNEACELAKDKRFDVHMIVEGDSFKTFRKYNVTFWIVPKEPLLKAFLRTFTLFKHINADFYLERSSKQKQRIYEPIICKLLGKKYAFIEVCDPILIMGQSGLKRYAYRVGLALASHIISNARLIQENLQLFTKRPVRNINISTKMDKPLLMKRKHILWVGRAHPLKRPEIFLKLAKEFPKERFVMAVAGKLKHDIARNVTVLPDVPHDEVNKYYSSAKIVVHTSCSEGFGNIFLEAWKNKTPIISLSVDPDDVLKEHNTGLHSGSFEHLIKDVKLLLRNKKKWKELSENGYKYVKKHHDVQQVIEQYKDFFTQHSPIQQRRA